MQDFHVFTNWVFAATVTVTFSSLYKPYTNLQEYISGGFARLHYGEGNVNKNVEI